MWPRLSGTWSDIAGGAAGAAIVIPIILSCGSVAYQSIGPAYTAVGITAAFVSAIVAAFVAGLFGGPTLHVNSPKTTHAAILSGLISTVAIHHSFTDLYPGDAAPGALMSICFITLIISGICQMLLGFCRLGILVKFVPYPVLAGLINGFAIQIIFTQLPKTLGFDTTSQLWHALVHTASINFWALGFALLSGALVFLSARFTKAIPSTLVALAGGTLAHHLTGSYIADTASLGTTIGALPLGVPFEWKTGEMLQFVSTTVFSRHVFPIFSTAMTLALVSSIQSLLSISSADSLSGSRHDSNKELIIQGGSNVLAALLGGTPSGGSPNVTQAVYANGGRGRAANLAHAGMLLALSYGLSNVISLIPLSVMGGVVIATTLGAMDRWTQQLLLNIGSSRSLSNRGELLVNLAIVFLIAALVVAFGAVAALGMGMAVKFMVFLYRSNSTMVRRVFTAEDMRSRTERSLAAMQLLQTQGHRVVVIELEGPLFFGSAETVIQQVEQEQRRADRVILDCRRVSQIDASGAMAVKRLDEFLRKSGKALFLSYLPAGGQRRNFLRAIGVPRPEAEGRIFEDTDSALARAEDDLLIKLGHQEKSPGVPLKDVSILQGFSEDELSLLSSMVAGAEAILGKLTPETCERLCKERPMIAMKLMQNLAFYAQCRGKVTHSRGERNSQSIGHPDNDITHRLGTREMFFHMRSLWHMPS